MKSKLYIEFRVHFDPKTNPELSEVAEATKDKLYDMFTDSGEDVPTTTAVTYELVREVGEEEITDEDFDVRPGDTLDSILKDFGITRENLK
jgi:hypothetical protein